MLTEKDITRNLFGFYHAIPGTDDHDCRCGEMLECICLPEFRWPSYLLGGKEIDQKKLALIAGWIRDGECPSFWIRKIEEGWDFDEIALEEGIRKVMEWKGMLLEQDKPFKTEAPGKGIRFSEIREKREIDLWLNLMNRELLTGKSLERNYFYQMAGKKEFELLALWEDDRIISTMLVYTKDDIAGIYLLTTSAEKRGMGYGKMITSLGLNSCIQKGLKKFVLQSTTAGQALYTKFGFREVCRYGIYWMVGKV